MHYGYILRAQITGLYKIGISGSVKKRFSNYKTHTPERITLEAEKHFISEDEARDWERWILRLHAKDIEHGEWLSVDFGEMANIWSLGFDPINNLEWKGDGDPFLVMIQSRYEEGEPLVRVFRCPDNKTANAWIDQLGLIVFRETILPLLPREITREYVFERASMDRENRSIRREIRERVLALGQDHPDVSLPDSWYESDISFRMMWLCQYYPKSIWRIAAAAGEGAD